MIYKARRAAFQASENENRAVFPIGQENNLRVHKNVLLFSSLCEIIIPEDE